MKRIMDGKMYDTETAKVVATSYAVGVARNDFRYYEEELHLKKTGEYFLYGEGGPMSRYAQSCGDGYESGSGIIPLTEAEAKKWAEQRLDADEYIAIFGEVEE
jgi:hypothetical protein